MTKRLKVLLPIAILIGGAVLMAIMVKAKPSVGRVAREVQPPLVRVVEVTSGPVALNVTSSGTVEPATRSTLVAQVGARVEKLSPRFAEGAFFDRGETLVRLDSRDFELAVTQAAARVAQARVQLEREEAEAQLAIEEWNELGEGTPSALVLREPQLAQARAEVASSQAALEQATLQLERTGIRAPFSGRVESKLVDVGQFAAPGTPLGTIYSTDRAEIALQVPQQDIAFLDVALGKPTGQQPRAMLTGRISENGSSWPARVVRTGSRIDPMTRMISIIAEVEDPFALAGTHSEPLPMGLFLDAEIEGKVAERAIVLPRAALREDGSVLVVDSDNRLEIRSVDVLRLEPDEAILSGGLADGERVCISRLAAVIEGMEVRVQDPSRAVTVPAIEGDAS